MLVKLYKIENDTLSYWEIWDVEVGLLVHWGMLGETGENKVIKIKPSKLDNAANKLIQEKVKEGYFQLEDDQLSELIIQFEEYGSPDDLSFRESTQNLINESLGWSGNGHSTDADIGNGTMNIFANVIDPYIACKTIRSTIQEKGIYRSFLIAIRKQNGSEVLYPEDFIGNFTYWSLGISGLLYGHH